MNQTPDDLRQRLEAMKSRISELESVVERRDRAESALRNSQLRYRTLYEENPSMYFTVDADGTVLSVNPFGASQLGYRVEDLEGRPVLGVFHPLDREAVRGQLARCVANPGKAFDWEFRKIRKDGETMWVRELARAVGDDDGNIVVLIVCEDITARKNIEQELRKAHEEMERRIDERTAELENQRRYLRQIIDVDPNLIFAKDREGRFTLVNQAVADVYGTTVDLIVGKRDADFSPNAEEVEFFRKKDLEVMDTLSELFIPEEPITDSTGATRWLQTVKRPLIDASGQATEILGSGTDITLRKEAEERLVRSEAELRRREAELRALTGRLLTAQEDERRHLAREMHDDLSQRLAALALQAGRLKGKVTSDSDGVDDLLAGLMSSLAEISTHIHDLSRRLHPSILEDLGLVVAIGAECEGYSKGQGIAVRFRNKDVPREIPRDVALCLYRITQEALRNVAKHARTREAQVSLTFAAGQLTLSIEDAGDGFEIDWDRRKAGLGLASMAERARLINAELSVRSEPGKGTMVKVTVPLDGNTARGS